ncbi:MULTISPECIES: GbsR/MarR family transcriptional regulator [Halorussus]|uniref:GbsR/MarR family transcriptional regulator n=1 Tax=Halorussus TaxID=1070314 RepID=UPI0020A0C45E|nr:helix-turn-helix domain-containing protein [Halorussus vallis]USZ76314.1 transcriptional regulator [Halorussus vallis]
MSEDGSAESANDGGTEVADETTSTSDEARERVVEAMERSAEVYGLNRSYGRLYGVLYFADGALSLDELVEESGYAKSTVSNAMGTLERLHVVHRRTKPGEGKRVFFEAERDFWRIFQELLRQQARRELQIMGRALTEAEDLLEAAPDTDRARRDLRRVRRLKRMYDRGERTLDFLTRLPLERLRSLVGQLTGESGEKGDDRRDDERA